MRTGDFLTHISSDRLNGGQMQAAQQSSGFFHSQRLDSRLVQGKQEEAFYLRGAVTKAVSLFIKSGFI